MKTLQHPLSLQQLSALGSKFVKTITPSEVEANAIEAATSMRRDLQDSLLQIAKCRHPTNLRMRLLCTKTPSLTSSALLWGREHESIARQQYTNNLPTGCTFPQQKAILVSPQMDWYLLVMEKCVAV